MKNAARHGSPGPAGLRLFSALLFALLAVGSAHAEPDLISQVLTDIRVLYLFEQPEDIDWPTLYYLNDGTGCRIDLVTVTTGTGVNEAVESEVSGRGIHLTTYELIDDSRAALDWALDHQFHLRVPDVVIIGSADFGPLMSALVSRVEARPGDPQSPFAIRKIYRLAPQAADSARTGSVVTIGRREMFERYRDRIELEVPQLFSWLRPAEFSDIRLMRYDRLRPETDNRRPDPDFLSGLEPLRLTPLFDTVLADGAVKRSLINRTRIFTTFLTQARRTVGLQRVENLVTGYKSLLLLVDQVKTEPTLANLSGFNQYMVDLADRTLQAVLQEIGMDWAGEIVLRDSPHGPRLKFRASLSVNGPQHIELSFVRFHPYWDSLPVVLDSVSRKIMPHQAFVREYLVDINRDYLEASMPESLLFSAEIVYASMPVTVASAVPIWERPDLGIALHPEFFFVPPVARLEVDRVVRAMNWKAVISKPLYYHGRATLTLSTPKGLYAGAYKQTLDLEKGRAGETVRIPFSVSNLFELGIQPVTLTLTVDNKLVAADTGRVRIAECTIDDKLDVGLLPDTSGLLEDILLMAGVNYRPLTDRTLQAGDLEAYDVILVGSGALRDYPSFRQITGRLEDYLRAGGSLVILGQPTDWPESALPVSFAPSVEHVRDNELLNRIPKARIASVSYPLSESVLLSYLSTRRKVSAAVISPAEYVYVTPSGATLLSVSRLDEGQIIYCGLPLVEMISELNIEAIHLLANILNY